MLWFYNMMRKFQCPYAYKTTPSLGFLTLNVAKLPTARIHMNIHLNSKCLLEPYCLTGKCKCISYRLSLYDSGTLYDLQINVSLKLKYYNVSLKLKYLQTSCMSVFVRFSR